MTHSFDYELPTKYLSASQVILWGKSVEQYHARYIDKKPLFETKYLLFGRRFSKYMETLDAKYLIPGLKEIAEQALVFYAPDGSRIVEKRYKVEVEGVPTYGLFDTARHDLSIIVDYKTGKYGEAEDYKEQMLFYATQVYWSTGKIPVVKVQWFETEETDELRFFPEGIKFTGRVEYLKDFMFDEADILDYTHKLHTVADQITRFYRYVKGGELPLVNEVLINKYMRILSQMEHVKALEAELREQVVDELDVLGLRYYQSPHGRLWLTPGGNLSARLKNHANGNSDF